MTKVEFEYGGNYWKDGNLNVIFPNFACMCIVCSPECFTCLFPSYLPGTMLSSDPTLQNPTCD